MGMTVQVQPYISGQGLDFSQYFRLPVAAWEGAMGGGDHMISGCGDLLLNLIGSGVAEYLWSIPLAIINEIFLFQFLYGCAGILMEVNYDLTDNWRKLWKWHLIVIAAPIGSALLLIFVSLFGMAILRLFVLPLLIVMAFGSIAVFVLQMVYLYQTVVCFRNWKPVDSRTGSIPD